MQWVMSADGPGAVGDRAYWLHELTEYNDREHAGFTPNPENTPEAILARCDEVGSTGRETRHESWNDGRYPPTGSWEDNGLICDQRWLPRENLPNLIDAYLDNGGYQIPDVDVLVERRILQAFGEDDNPIDNGPPL